MRFLSSSALASVEKFRLAANCSAAETMRPLSFPPRAQGSIWGSGGRFARRRFWRQHRDRAAGLFDGGDGGLRSSGNREGKFGAELTAAEKAHAMPRPAQHARLHQRLDIDLHGGIQTPGIDRLLHAAEAHFVEALAENVVEPALGQPAMQRHLPAFEALDGNAGTGLLALDAAPAGLALAGTDAAADAAPDLARAGIVAQLAQLHRSSPSTTRTRCPTLAIMPRVAAVSGSSDTRSIRLRPSPIRVWRWSYLRRAALATCRTLIFFAPAMSCSPRLARFS